MYYVVDKVTFNFQIYFISLQLFYTAKVSSVKIINQYVHVSNKVIFEIILQALLNLALKLCPELWSSIFFYAMNFGMLEFYLWHFCKISNIH